MTAKPKPPRFRRGTYALFRANPGLRQYYPCLVLGDDGQRATIAVWGDGFSSDKEVDRHRIEPIDLDEFYDWVEQWRFDREVVARQVKTLLR